VSIDVTHKIVSNRNRNDKMTANESVRLSVEKVKCADNATAPKLKFKDSIPQIIASCSINLTVIHAGINMSFSSILIPQLSVPESDIKIDLDSSSTVASIVTLSIALGALACGPLMDKLGRKYEMHLIEWLSHICVHISRKKKCRNYKMMATICRSGSL
jgi:hypothetical protein